MGCLIDLCAFPIWAGDGSFEGGWLSESRLAMQRRLMGSSWTPSEIDSRVNSS